MARVPRAGGSSRHSSTVLDRPRAVNQRAASRKPKKPYKILLEAVTQEKRKLQSILTYHDQAPEGFGYIPVGYPEITEWCKEQCRQRSLDVHIVSAKPKNKIHTDPEKISHHVHRIGHHFPLSIIELACAKFGYTFSIDGGLQKRSRAMYGDAYFERGIADYQSRHALHGAPPANGFESKEHISGAIREMFPKIPEADLNAIVNHAFQQGTNRVGNAKELSLARRVQLAVVAHIRHVYTEYDRILKNKTGSWNEARQQVEQVSLAKLKEWRDEAGEASNELEETFREVIVLDDDDEEEDDVSNDITHADVRESSMEVFSSRATARDLQPEPVDDVRRHEPRLLWAPRRHVFLEPLSPRVRQSFPPVPSSIHHSSHAAAEQRFPPPHHVYELEPPRPRMYDALHRPAEPRLSIGPVPHPRQVRGADGRLYNLQPIEEPRSDDRIVRVETPTRLVYTHPSDAPYHLIRDDRPPRFEGRPSRSVLVPSSRRASDQDLVLPSVEREPLVRPEGSLERSHRADSVSHFEIRTPKRKSFPSAYYSPQEPHSEQPPKRPRPVSNIEYSQPLPDVTYGFQPANPDSSPMRPLLSGHRDVHAGASGASYAPSTARVPISERIPAQPNSPVALRGPAPPTQWSHAQSRRYDDVYSSRARPPVKHGTSHAHSGWPSYRSSRVEAHRP